MIPLSLAEVAEATGGHLAPGTDPLIRVTGPVVADSRQVVPGALLVALVGERSDGHDFVAQGLQAGAVASLVTRAVPGPHVLVDDPLVALGCLARRVVDTLAERGLSVIGVTGSSGKTTTKDLLAQMLSTQAPTVAPPGSFNNDLGLPLTALRCDATTAYLVAEMGARGLGHIARLCAVTPPNIGVVLNIGAAHAGEFGSLEVTAQAKGELIESLPATGVAVLNADDPRVAAMAQRTSARILTFGENEFAQVRATAVRVDDQGRAHFEIAVDGRALAVDLRVRGRHQVANALAAFAVGLALERDPAALALGLSRAEPQSRWRMEVSTRPDGLTVINDSYNANPDSMAAALSTLADFGGSATRRRWAVLGEMLELGEASQHEHARLAGAARDLGIDALLSVGTDLYLTSSSSDGAPHAQDRRDFARATAGIDQALAVLAHEVRPGDVVLIKASRGIGLDRLAERLLADGPAGLEVTGGIPRVGSAVGEQPEEDKA